MLDNASHDGSAARPRAATPTGDRGHRAASSGAARRRTTRALLQRARGALLPAAQRGLRAAAGRGRGAARGARATARAAPPARSCCDPDGAPQPSRLALPGVGDRARSGALPAPPLHRAEPRRPHARGRLGAVGGAARAHARPRPPSASSTRRSSSTPTRSTSASACATPAGASSTCPRPSRPPRAALDRRGRPSGGSSSPPQPRPLHAQAPLAAAAARRARG